MVTPYGVRPGDLEGTTSFRMMPDDEFGSGPSAASVTSIAGDRALSVAYWWTHPEDQQRHEGLFVIGLPDDDGRVTAAWVDAWQQQALVAISGRATEKGALLEYEYAPGWRWQVELEVSGGVPCLVMRNIVPPDQGGPAGPYEVSRTDWS